MNRIETRVSRVAVSAWILALVLAGSVVAAKGPPIPEPDPERGSIAVEIKVGMSRAIQAFFVRVEDEVDLFEAEYVLPSNYSSKKQIYLLNAKPGRYVVVAARASKQQGFTTQTNDAYFDMEMIRQTEVEVVPNSVVFLGEISAKYADQKQMKDADAAQAHYFRVIDPRAASRGAFARAYLGNKVANRVVLNSIVRDPSCERAFWLAAEGKAFKDEGAWQSLIDERLAGLAKLGP